MVGVGRDLERQGKEPGSPPAVGRRRLARFADADRGATDGLTGGGRDHPDPEPALGEYWRGMATGCQKADRQEAEEQDGDPDLHNWPLHMITRFPFNSGTALQI